VKYLCRFTLNVRSSESVSDPPPPPPKMSIIVCLTNCRVVHLQKCVPHSSWLISEREREGGREGGSGAGNDLSFPAHGSQMFSRISQASRVRHGPTPRRIQNYSCCFPRGSLELLNQLPGRYAHTHTETCVCVGGVCSDEGVGGAS